MTKVNLVGQFFHRLKTEEDGCTVVCGSGRVLARVEPGLYLVETLLARRLVRVEDMLDWTFYGEYADLTATYENVWKFQSDRHHRHHNRLTP